MAERAPGHTRATWAVFSFAACRYRDTNRSMASLGTRRVWSSWFAKKDKSERRAKTPGVFPTIDVFEGTAMPSVVSRLAGQSIFSMSGYALVIF